jgi:hypothetical protein
MEDKFESFRQRILAIRKTAENLGEKMFLEIPDRWLEYPGPKFRCKNNHVSSFIIMSEEKGDLCMECHENLFMTFPEDKDGPIGDIEKHWIHEKLVTLGNKYDEENSYSSAMPHGNTFDEIVKIAKTGNLAIQVILELLIIERTWHWVLALSKATGEHPFPERAAGNIDEICSAWEKWGIENGFLTDKRIEE